MANYRILLLITIFSIFMGLISCQLSIEKALADLDEAGKLKGSEIFNWNPIDIPPKETVIELKEVSMKMQREKNKFNNMSIPMVQKIFDVISNKDDFKERIHQLLIYRGEIVEIHQNFAKFTKSLNESSNITEIDRFFQDILYPLKKISIALERIQIVLIGNDTHQTDWFQFLGNYARNFKGSVCDEKRLIQGHIFNFYNFVFDMEYRTSLLLVVAYRHITRRNLGNHKGDMVRVSEKSEMRLKGYTSRASAAMKDVPRDIYNCDDGSNKNGTYTALRGFSQGFLINPDLLDSKSCQPNEVKANACSNNMVDCLNSTCIENLTDCRDITEGMGKTNTLYVCPSFDNVKRYNWALFDDKPFGEFISKDKCENSILPYQMYLDGKQSNMCYCNCERTKWKSADIRAISLAEVRSDYNRNRVITNIKFEEKNGIIHLRAQEGHVLPGGKVDRSTLVWIKTPSLSLVLKNDSKIPFYSAFDNNKGSSTWLPGRDFVYISKNLYINLDDIIAPEFSVIIGVGLMKRNATGNSPYDELELRISTMEYNYLSGTLMDRDEISQITNDIKNRKTINLGSAGIPTKSSKLNNVLSNPNENVLFQRSNAKNDLGQSIVPFFDTRPLNPGILTALSGIGIYHRGCENSGGFISLKIIPSDVSDFLTRG